MTEPAPGTILRVDQLPARCVFITSTGVVFYKREAHFAVVSYDGKKPAPELRLATIDMRTLALLGPKVELVSSSEVLCQYGARGMMEAVVRPYLDQRAERLSVDIASDQDGAVVSLGQAQIQLAVRCEGERDFRVVELRGKDDPVILASFLDRESARRAAVAIGIMFTAGLRVAWDLRGMPVSHTSSTFALYHLRSFMREVQFIE